MEGSLGLGIGERRRNGDKRSISADSVLVGLKPGVKTSDSMLRSAIHVFAGPCVARRHHDLVLENVSPTKDSDGTLQQVGPLAQVSAPGSYANRPLAASEPPVNRCAEP